MGDRIDERAVITRVRQGEVNAFALLVNGHKHEVARIVGRHVPQDRLEEVAHDVFVRAYQSLDSFRAEKPFAHWLAVIAVRTCQDFWRAHHRNLEMPFSQLEPEGVEWLESFAAPEARESFETELERREAHRLLEWAMAQLSYKDRMVLTLTYLEGYSSSETAEMLGCTQTSVKVRALRGRRKLRQIIADVLDDMEGKP